jgi:hypothetical protein
MCCTWNLSANAVAFSTPARPPQRRTCSMYYSFPHLPNPFYNGVGRHATLGVIDECRNGGSASCRCNSSIPVIRKRERRTVYQYHYSITTVIIHDIGAKEPDDRYKVRRITRHGPPVVFYNRPMWSASTGLPDIGSTVPVSAQVSSRGRLTYAVMMGGIWGLIRRSSQEPPAEAER